MFALEDLRRCKVAEFQKYGKVQYHIYTVYKYFKINSLRYGKPA